MESSVTKFRCILKLDIVSESMDGSGALSD